MRPRTATLAAMGIKVTIRDGRVGRDPAQAKPDGPGGVLAVTERDVPLREGEKIKLDDGTEVVVIGLEQEIGPTGWAQTVDVGDVFETP